MKHSFTDWRTPRDWRRVWADAPRFFGCCCGPTGPCTTTVSCCGSQELPCRLHADIALTGTGTLSCSTTVSLDLCKRSNNAHWYGLKRVGSYVWNVDFQCNFLGSTSANFSAIMFAAGTGCSGGVSAFQNVESVLHSQCSDAFDETEVSQATGTVVGIDIFGGFLMSHSCNPMSFYWSRSISTEGSQPYWLCSCGKTTPLAAGESYTAELTITEPV